ncbi:MAG: FMN-binding protein [Spirochaetaceae bacterium]|nr:MAG: FMN-binding protein [Spirochaetaceae bacterium]
MKYRAHIIALPWLMVAAAVLIVSCARERDETRLEGLQDGIYMGSAEYTDGNGWAPFLQLTVEDGAVSSVVFDYVDAGGGFKSQDGAYNLRMKSAAGTSPEEYTLELADRLTSAQSLPVEAVSGATSSSNWFNQLADAVVARAMAGDSRVALLPMSSTYRAEDEPDERGWIATIAIRYERQSIAQIEYDEIRREDGSISARKSEDPAYAERWNAATGVDQTTVFPRLAEQLKDEGRPAGVDIISGATSSSRRFRIVAQAAMDTRAAVDFRLIQDALR